MKITIKELRRYIRNALSPSTSNRTQIGTLGKKEQLGSPDEEFSIIDEPVDDPGKIVINDPYVTQDGPAPSSGERKLGISSR